MDDPFDTSSEDSYDDLFGHIKPAASRAIESPGIWDTYVKPVIHGVGRVASVPLRGIGNVATALESTARYGDPLAEFKLRPEDRESGIDADVGGEAYKVIKRGYTELAGLPLGETRVPTTPQADEAAASVSPEVEQQLHRKNPLTFRAEAVADPLLELGTQFALDPVLHGLGHLGGIAGKAKAAEAALTSGEISEAAPEAYAAAQRAIEAAGKIPLGADTAHKVLGAAFIPGMAEGAYERGTKELPRAIREFGWTSPEAIRAGLGAAADTAFAGLGALHAAGLNPTIENGRPTLRKIEGPSPEAAGDLIPEVAQAWRDRGEDAWGALQEKAAQEGPVPIAPGQPAVRQYTSTAPPPEVTGLATDIPASLDERGRSIFSQPVVASVPGPGAPGFTGEPGDQHGMAPALNEPPYLAGIRSEGVDAPPPTAEAPRIAPPAPGTPGFDYEPLTAGMAPPEDTALRAPGTPSGRSAGVEPPLPPVELAKIPPPAPGTPGFEYEPATEGMLPPPPKQPTPGPLDAQVAQQQAEQQAKQQQQIAFQQAGTAEAQQAAADLQEQQRAQQEQQRAQQESERARAQQEQQAAEEALRQRFEQEPGLEEELQLRDTERRLSDAVRKQRAERLRGGPDAQAELRLRDAEAALEATRSRLKELTAKPEAEPEPAAEPPQQQQSLPLEPEPTPSRGRLPEPARDENGVRILPGEEHLSSAEREMTDVAIDDAFRQAKALREEAVKSLSSMKQRILAAAGVLEKDSEATKKQKLSSGAESVLYEENQGGRVDPNTEKLVEIALRDITRDTLGRKTGTPKREFDAAALEGTPLEGAEYSIQEIENWLRKDKGNKVEAKLRELVRKNLEAQGEEQAYADEVPFMARRRPVQSGPGLFDQPETREPEPEAKAPEPRDTRADDAHLDAWLERYFGHAERESRIARGQIKTYLADNPDLLDRGASWPEILRMAESEPKEDLGHGPVDYESRGSEWRAADDLGHSEWEPTRDAALAGLKRNIEEYGRRQAEEKAAAREEIQRSGAAAPGVAPRSEFGAPRPGGLATTIENTKAGQQRTLVSALDTSSRIKPLSAFHESPLFNQEREAEIRRVERSQASLFEEEPQLMERKQASDVSPLGFFSQLRRVVEGKQAPKVASGSDWIRFLADTKRGVKSAEMKWTGLDDFLKARSGQKVTQAEIAEFLRTHDVQVKEVTLGRTPERARLFDESETLREEEDHLLSELERGAASDPEWPLHLPAQFADEDPSRLPVAYRASAERLGDVRELMRTNSAAMRELGEPGATKFSQYQLSGGENYREVVLYTPKAPPKPKRSEIKPDEKALSEHRDEWERATHAIDSGSQDLPKGYRLQENPSLLGDRWHVRDESGRSVASSSTPEHAVRNFRETVLDDIHRKMVDETISRIPEQQLAVWQSSEPFKSGHFDTPGSYLAHMRLSDRIDADGKRVLLVDEVQSDLAQKGRREGFRTSSPPEAEILKRLSDAGYEAHNNGANWVVRAKDGSRVPNRLAGGSAEYQFAHSLGQVAGMVLGDREISAVFQRGRPSAAPFVEKTEDWSALVMKRILRMAAEGGYDRVAWTPGDVQVERYRKALRKAVDRIEWTKTKEGIHLRGVKNGETVVDTTERENALSDAIGKAMGDRIVEDREQSGVIEGDDLTISDTGMAGFYDTILPGVVAKLGKKFGAKVGESKIEAGGETVTAHSIDINPEMRSSAMEGQPLFAERTPREDQRVAFWRSMISDRSVPEHIRTAFREMLQKKPTGDRAVIDRAVSEAESTIDLGDEHVTSLATGDLGARVAVADRVVRRSEDVQGEEAKAIASLGPEDRKEARLLSKVADRLRPDSPVLAKIEDRRQQLITKGALRLDRAQKIVESTQDRYERAASDASAFLDRADALGDNATPEEVADVSAQARQFLGEKAARNARGYTFKERAQASLEEKQRRVMEAEARDKVQVGPVDIASPDAEHDAVAHELGQALGTDAAREIKHAADSLSRQISRVIGSKAARLLGLSVDGGAHGYSIRDGIRVNVLAEWERAQARAEGKRTEAGRSVEREAARGIVNVLVHELAHDAVKGHGKDHAEQMLRIMRAVAGEPMVKLRARIEAALRGRDLGPVLAQAKEVWGETGEPGRRGGGADRSLATEAWDRPGAGEAGAPGGEAGGPGLEEVVPPGGERAAGGVGEGAGREVGSASLSTRGGKSPLVPGRALRFLNRSGLSEADLANGDVASFVHDLDRGAISREDFRPPPPSDHDIAYRAADGKWRTANSREVPTEGFGTLSDFGFYMKPPDAITPEDVHGSSPAVWNTEHGYRNALARMNDAFPGRFILDREPHDYVYVGHKHASDQGAWFLKGTERPMPYQRVLETRTLDVPVIKDLLAGPIAVATARSRGETRAELRHRGASPEEIASTDVEFMQRAPGQPEPGVSPEESRRRLEEWRAGRSGKTPPPPEPPGRPAGEAQPGEPLAQAAAPKPAPGQPGFEKRVIKPIAAPSRPAAEPAPGQPGFESGTLVQWVPPGGKKLTGMVLNTPDVLGRVTVREDGSGRLHAVKTSALERVQQATQREPWTDFGMKEHVGQLTSKAKYKGSVYPEGKPSEDTAPINLGKLNLPESTRADMSREFEANRELYAGDSPKSLEHMEREAAEFVREIGGPKVVEEAIKAGVPLNNYKVVAVARKILLDKSANVARLGDALQEAVRTGKGKIDAEREFLAASLDRANYTAAFRGAQKEAARALTAFRIFHETHGPLSLVLRKLLNESC